MPAVRFGAEAGSSGAKAELVTRPLPNGMRVERFQTRARTLNLDAAGNNTDYELDITGRVHGEWKKRTRADGIVEDILTALSRFKSFAVIAGTHVATRAFPYPNARLSMAMARRTPRRIAATSNANRAWPNIRVR